MEVPCTESWLHCPWLGSDPEGWPEPTTQSHGPYASEALAAAAACGLRRGICQFEGWGDVFAEGGPPP